MAFSVIRERSRPFPTAYLSAGVEALHHPDPHHTPSQDDMLERHVAPSPSCYADEGCVINVSILPSKPEEGPSAAIPVKQHAIENQGHLFKGRQSL